MSPEQKISSRTPGIGAQQLRLLERLCNASGVSGDEGEVRKIVLEEVKNLGEARVDALGNVLVSHIGSGNNRMRVMLDAHMDEVGFMIVSDDDEGLFRFDRVGGVDPRQLPGKPVLVGSEHIPGVIGARAIHLTTAEERKRTIPIDQLRIDVGPGGSSKVKIGDRAVFATRFTRLGPSLYAKALDDRLGVATLIELLRRPPEQVDILASFSVQEEIGGRGAQVGAYFFNPDLAIIIDSTPALDLPVWDDSENVVYNSKLDGGPAIYVADNSTLSDPRLIQHFVRTANQNNIPFQFRQPGSGGTNAGAIHRTRAGIPSLSISVPGRYPHSAGAIARISDWKNTLALLFTGINSLSPELLAVSR
jgi:endoglucanase